MTWTPGSETASTPVVTTINSLSTFESAFSSSRLTEGSSSLADETSLVESSPTAVLTLTAIVTDFTPTTYFVDGESSSRESGFQSTSLRIVNDKPIICLPNSPADIIGNSHSTNNITAPANNRSPGVTKGGNDGGGLGGENNGKREQHRVQGQDTEW
ncbi:hypothetical protein C0Q70_04539 [Pomacea canaliculata]|uniref:Uncharacterized protein n=1 Tax=Pomacea canaliculata TaxID=400727 RepID=A0A2T7PIM9_POMCA|nr:hypothetical protein C0Q70_04539 [Pomacea canaliculata]